MWKDASGELTEIELDDGAEAVLIATHVAIGESSTADGRRHPGTTATLTLAGVHSIAAGTMTRKETVHPTAPSSTEPPRLPTLVESEVSKAASWAEAIAEAAVFDSERLSAMMTEATSSALRAQLGLSSPSRLFVESVDVLRRELPPAPTVDDLFRAAKSLQRAPEPASVITGTLIDIALQQRILAEVQAGRLPTDALVGID